MKAPERSRCVPVITREYSPGVLGARILQLIEDGRLGSAANVRLTGRAFHVNRRGAPGQLAFENYWQGTPS
jgi:hypothetical protein